TFGLPDGGRSLFPDDRFRVEARDPQRRPLRWSGRAGTGLGNLELEAHQVLFGLEDPRRWRGAAVLRLSAPTATCPFAHAGSAAGLQFVIARPLGARTNVYAALCATASRRLDGEGLEYGRSRGPWFLSLARRPT